MALPANNSTWVDVAICQPRRCPDDCDAQEECVVVAVSERGGDTPIDANPSFGINLLGGDLDEWTVTLMSAALIPVAWTTDASFVLCIGEFIIIGSSAAMAIVRSDDRGATWATVTSATVASWDTVGPIRQIDAIDQTYILICGENGYIYVSYDAGRTWQTCEAGLLTAADEDYTRIMIARDNPQVAYVVSTAGNVNKTKNGGETWFATNAGQYTGGHIILALDVKSQSDVLILNNVGELWQTEDGGVTWRVQETLPDMPAAPTQADIVHCGCEEFYIVASDMTNGVDAQIWRNVYGGCGGFWYHPKGQDPATGLYAIACCDSNRAVAVGGTSDDEGYMYLLA